MALRGGERPPVRSFCSRWSAENGDWLEKRTNVGSSWRAQNPARNLRVTLAVCGASGFVAHPPMNIANATKAWTGHFFYATYSFARRQHLPCFTRSSYGLTPFMCVCPFEHGGKWPSGPAY